MTSQRTIPALATLALLFAPLPARAQAPAEPALVIVSGVGVIRRAPDVAYVVFGAESRNVSPAVAQRNAATAMTTVQERLRGAGIAADALRTLAYDLSPEYDYVENRRVLRGYVARHRLEVRVDGVDRVGDLVDVGVSAGAASVEGLRFDVKDRATAEREALRAATADAWARAEAAAAGVGRTISRVVRIEEPATAPPVPVREMLAVASQSAEPAPPIMAGQVEIRARVTLTAEIR